jgi:hypothetical protein
VQTLKKVSSTNGLAYRNLFCEDMAFPLVTPEDLVQWLAKLAPNVEVVLGDLSGKGNLLSARTLGID